MKRLIISDNPEETSLIIRINDVSFGDLPLSITISDTCKNHPKRLDFDNNINLSSLIVSLETLFNPHQVNHGTRRTLVRLPLPGGESDRYFPNGLSPEVKRKVKRIHIDGCRYNERLNTKTEGNKHLRYTG